MSPKTLLLRASTALPIVLTAAGSAGLGASPALAACGTAGTVTTCTGASPNPNTGTIGTGPGLNGRTVNVLNGAILSVTNSPAVSLGDNATVNLRTGAQVQAVTNGGSGNFGSGPNVVEFNSNGTLLVEQGASIVKTGSEVTSEAVNVHGFGNTITNYGTIRTSGSAALWFEDTTTGPVKNVVDNFGTIERVGGGAVFGTNGGAGIQFRNRTGGVVTGDLSFAQGDDDLTFFAGSTVSGSINGGAGTNTLTLQGAAGSEDTLRGDVANFQALTKDGVGRWIIGGSLSGFQSTTVRQGTLTLTGDNADYSAGILVEAAGTLEARARSLPTTPENTANVRNNGLVRFLQPADGTYAGQIVGTGRVEKAGSGVVRLTANHGYAGGTTVAAGTLLLGADGASGSIVGNVVDNGVFGFDRADAYSFGGVISGTGSVLQTGAGTTTLTGLNSYAAGTLILDGTLQVAADANLGAASGGLVLNGGTLRTTMDLATARNALLLERGGRIDTTATTLTDSGTIFGPGWLEKAGGGALVLTGTSSYAGGTMIAEGRLQLGDGGTTGSIIGDVVDQGVLAFDRANRVDFDGAITGSGSVQQLGTGAIRLNGGGSYAGPTDVRAGALYVNGNQAAATGPTTAVAGTTLGGAGTIGGDVTIADGATLAPGDLGTTPGTLGIRGDLGLGAGAVLDYAFGEANVAGGARNDLVNVGGNLRLDGTIDVAVSPGGSVGAGVYRVFNYAGALTDQGLEIGSMPAGGVLVQTSVANQVNLVNTRGLTLDWWDGAAGPKNNGVPDGGDGVWQGSAGNDTWTEATGRVNAPFSDGSFAIFAGAPGTVTVDDELGAVTVSGMQFLTDGYVIQGDEVALDGVPSGEIRVGDGTAAGAAMTATIASAVTGGAQLAKTDLGTLVLSGANSYTGGTLVRGGVLQVASDANLGEASGGLTLDDGTLEATADMTNARTTTLGAGGGGIGAAAGTSFTQASAITGAGGLEKRGPGELVMTGDSSYAGGTIIAAGTLRLGDGGATGSLTGDVIDNGLLTFDRSNALTVAGAISGTGGVRQAGSGTTTLSGASSYSGGTVIDAGVLQVSQDANLGDAAGTLAIDGGTLRTTSGFAMARATSLGADGGTFDIAAGALDHMGPINGAGGLTKAGAGDLNLGGSNGYAGATAVAAGRLYVNGDQSAATGAATVSAGGTLGGNGTIGGEVTIAEGATLAPGRAGASPGTLTIAGGLNLSPGARLGYSFGAAGTVGGAFNDLVDVGGDLTLDGAFDVVATPDGAFGPGVYRVINYGGALTDNGLAIGALPSPDFSVQTSVAHQVNLINTAGLTLDWWDGDPGPKYDGVADGGSGVWQGSGGNDNWTEASGAINAPFADGGFAIFGGAAGTVSVDDGLGDVAVAGMQFLTGGYVVEGDPITLAGSAETPVRVGDGSEGGAATVTRIDAVLAGDSALAKTDLGTLELTAANSYTGGTRIRGGALAISRDASLGAAAGGLSLDGGTLRATGDLATARATTIGAGGGTIDTTSATVTHAGTIEGVGALTKTGSGTLVLSGTASHAGGTTMAQGTLQIGAGGAGGSIAGDIVDNATLAFDRSDDFGFDGAISGSGEVVQRGSGATTLRGANRHTGATVVLDGTLAAGATGVLSAASAHATGTNGTLDLAGFSQAVASLANGGRVALGEAAGARLTVKGDYAGQGGVLRFTTALGGDASPTDLMTVAGDTAGSSIVEVRNDGGIGAPTANGIRIIDVGGASNGSFTLAGDFVFEGRPSIVAGAYAYSLFKNGIATPGDGDWYLRSGLISPGGGGSQVQPGVPIYEAYPSTLLALNGLPTMQERIGNRAWSVPGQTSDGEVEDKRAWARVEATNSQLEPEVSNDDAPRYDLATTRLQVGIDRPVGDAAGGTLIGGASFNYGTVDNRVASDFGDGRIETEGYGVGGSLTWFRNDGLYLDGQAHLTWYDSDLSSDLVDDGLADGNDGFGWALGVEGGRRIALGDAWSLTPQGQLVYSSVNFDSFDDRFGAHVSEDDGASMPLRLGLSVDQERADESDRLGRTRTHLYGIANIYYDLMGDTGTSVDATRFTTETQDFWGSLGIGATYSWKGGAYGVYGEGLLASSLADFGDNYSNRVSIGFRAAW